MTAGDRYAPEEVSLLCAEYPRRPLVAIARLLDRSPHSVQQKAYTLVRRGVLSPAQRAYGRRWTRREDDVLRVHYGLHTDAWLARKLNRSVLAVRNRAHLLGQAKKDNVVTAYDVGRLFGVDSKAIPQWVARGWLRATRAPITIGRHHTVHCVSMASVVEHVTERAWAYWPEKMQRGHWLTDLAHQVAAREQWLTSEQAAARLHVCREYIHKLAREAGLPHQRRPRYGKGGTRHGTIVIRAADLDTWWQWWQQRPDYRRVRPMPAHPPMQPQGA